MTPQKNELATPAQGGLTLIGGLTPSDLKELDVDKVQALMDMQAKVDERNAEKALADALAKFQESAPRIHKGRKGGHGTYAGLDDIMEEIRPHLAANGLSVSFDTEGGEKTVTATCYVMHRDGASFSRKAAVPVDMGGRANAAQQMGSAISYGKRYSLAAALNIVTTDEDDDGEAAGAQTIAEEKVDRICELADQVKSKTELERFWEWVGVENAVEIPADKFKRAETALKKIIKREHDENS